jgi:aminopeptidase N
MRLKTTLGVLAILITASFAQAQRLPRTVFPIHYDLIFEPDLAKATFNGQEAIEISVQRPATSITLHAMQLKLHEATIVVGIDTQPATVTYDTPSETATLTFAKPLQAGRAAIHIAYTGILNNDLRGLYLGEANGRRYASTQFEATAARYAFPSFDEPEMKATFTVTAVVDEGDNAISNGAVVADYKFPQGKHTFKFATTPRMSTYLVALTVGAFDCLKDQVDGIPLRVCATPDKIANGRFALEATKAIVGFYNRYYGTRYAFGKLDQVAVPDFSAGAMENTGDIIYRETALLVGDNDSIERKKGVASVIAHEIAHQWFGDLVTMKWWNDLWLNEGFATFMAPKPLKTWKPDWDFEASEVVDSRGTLTTDSLRSTRAIRAEATTSAQIENMFDAIAYGKTAWMLRMVESYIGEEAMRKGIDEYIATNAYANTAAEDFTRSMDRASSKPVADVISSYVRNAGLPLITVASLCDAGATTFTLTQQRFFSDPSLSGAPPPSPAWVIPVCFRDQCELFREKQQTFRVSGCDPLYLNRNARGYYITQYEPDEVLRLATSPSLTNFERYALLREDWLLVLSGRRDVADYIRVANALRSARDPHVVRQLATAFDTIGARLTTPATDAAFRKWVTDYLRPIATELGWSPRPGESEETRELRNTVLATLGAAGRDRATLDKANDLTKRALQGDAKAIDPSLLDTVFELAAVRSDSALYEKLMLALAKSNDPQEQRRLRGVIAVFEDPKLAIRTLEWSLTPAVRNQDAGNVMSQVLVTPHVQTEAWDYFIKNWPRFIAKLPAGGAGGGRGGPITALGAICDPALRDRAAAALREHPIAGTERRVALAIERATQCIAMREIQAPRLAHAF